MLGVHDADHVVQPVLAEHGEAGPAGRPGGGDDGGDRLVGPQRRQPHPRGEHVPGPLVRERGRPDEQRRGVRAEGAALGGAADQRHQLLGGAGRGQLLGRLDADSPHQPVGRVVQQRDHRPEQPGEAAHRPLHRPCRRQRPGDGDVLRDQLAGHHRHRGREHQRDRHRHALGRALGHPERGHRAGQQGGHGRLGQEADQQVGDRDPELGAGELGGQPAQRRQHAAGGPVAALGGPLDRGPVDGHERELRRDEHPAGDHQPDAEQDEQPLDQHGSPLWQGSSVTLPSLPTDGCHAA